MDDHDAFERQVAAEMTRKAGPVRPVDDLEVLAVATSGSTARRWRLPSLSGLTKQAAAVGIVALFGGVLVVGFATSRTTDDESTQGLQAGSSHRIRPVEFSGTLAFGPCTNVKSSVYENRVTRTLGADIGRYCEPRIVKPFSDARLRGDVFDWQNSDLYGLAPLVTHSGFSIRNDEGAWQQIPGVTIEFSDGTTSTGIRVLEGSGAYDGLLAIAEVSVEQDEWTWRGWIVEGDLPPEPAPPPGAG